MKNILLSLLLAATAPTWSQSLLEPYATRWQRLAALAPSFTSAEAQEHNPASIASLEKPAAALSAERRFLLAALSSYRMHASLPVPGGAAGFGMVCGGSPDWREWSLRGSYARRLGSKASLGVGVAWQQAGNNIYGHASALLASAGLRWQLAKGVYAGCTLHNPARVRLGKEDTERLPAQFALGLAWEQARQWMLAFELAQRSGEPPAVLAGMEYVFAEALRARCGIDSGRSAAWLGLGTRAAGLRLDVTVMLHRELGTTTALTLIYPAQ